MIDFQNYDEIFNRNNYPVFDKVTLIPKDNKSCICLSGKKYIDCCKPLIEEANILRKDNPNLADETLAELYDRKIKKMLSYRIENKAIDKKNVSYCSANKVFSNCDIGNHMTRSHTMSRGNVLTKLGNGSGLVRFNDHVTPKNANMTNYFKDISERDASVTVSFCKKHDEELFAEIEKDGKTDYLGTNIQNLEYALKAISFDVYYKVMNIKYLAELVEQNKFVTSIPDGSNSLFFKNYHNTVETLFLLYPLMIELLETLKAGAEKSTLVTVIFELPSERINYSLSEVLEIENTICFINVINCQKPFIIISYFQDGVRVKSIDLMKDEFEKLKQESESIEIISLFSFTKLLLINSQNIYFNKLEFDKLDERVKEYLFIVHREGAKGIPTKIQEKYDLIIFSMLYNIV